MNDFKKFNNFRHQHGSDNFPTIELAKEFAELKRNWWGSNLIILPTKENSDGTFSPQFNVWD